MDIPKFYKDIALPSSPTPANDGVYFIRPNSSVGYVCWIISNGVAVQQDAVTTASMLAITGVLSNLTTTNKANLVAAINEVKAQTDGRLEKASLALSPASAWDTLSENRIVHSTSGANSPFTTYGVGINLYGVGSSRGQLFINTLNTGAQNLQFRAGGVSGQWSVVKTVWDNTNFNPSQYVLATDLNTRLANYVTTDSAQNITAAKTFTVAPIVPDATLAGHTVNLGQMQTYVTSQIVTYTSSTSVIKNNNSFERAALTGDVTAPQNSNATTIANKAVTNAKMADMGANTFKGRLGTAGAPQDLTAAQMESVLGYSKESVSRITVTNSQSVNIITKKTAVHLNVPSGGPVVTITVGNGNKEGDELSFSFNSANLEYVVSGNVISGAVSGNIQSYNRPMLFWWSVSENAWIKAN